ncbi:SDR family NAD(P)-dependent oxidoreductase [Streptomyces sp. NPDC088729]|uniref:SDR family NAD(P)-dependent oxidoreductase n=1 Tax=Streptomyces sp. NPDC088729 TaxID=3365876 RepID=UPI0037F90B9F
MPMTYRGTTALITGASSGLGVEFARQWARLGADVVLVARRRDRLDALADDLVARHRITATVVDADLARPGAGQRLHTELTDRNVSVQTVVNNAGFGGYGPFREQDPDEIARMIQLNTGALADITRAFLPDLMADGRGALVNVASTAAYQPTPNMALYGATKAFVLSLTEAVAHETRRSSLRVLAVSPGTTRTEFFDVVGSQDAMVGRAATAEDVVTATRRALDRDSTPPSIVTGLGNRLTTVATSLLPRRVVVAATGQALKA